MQKMKNVTFFQTFRKRLMINLFLTLVLLIGGGNSAWAQKSLPYEYNFNGKSNSDLENDGWSYTGYGSTGVSTFGGVSSSYCFRFYPNENIQYLYSPQLAPSSNGLSVSFAYKGYGSSYPVEFYVGYKSSAESEYTWGEKITYASTSWTNFEQSYPSGTAYIAIKYENSTSNYYLFVDDFFIEENDPYKTPTSFALDAYDATSATFSWTAGNSETAWQFAYSNNSNFTPGTDGTTLDISENPYTLSGLTTGTTYYAAIRANYGSGNYSDWSDIVSFTPRPETETTINSIGAGTSGYGLFYTSSIKSSLIRFQVIIPSTTLSAINGRQITKLTFYASAEAPNLGSGKYEVYLKEVANTSYSSKTMGDWGTLVYNSASLSISNYEMVITFDTPFNYNGGNLQIGIKQTEKSNNSPYMSWYCVTGISQSNRQSQDNGEATYYAYNPKITITSTPVTTAPVQLDDNGYTTFASAWPLDLTKANLPSGLKAYKAKVDLENNKVKFTEINQAVPANTGMLLEGTANTTYAIPVAVSGTAPEGNEFLVNSTGGTFTAEDNYTYYGLLKNSNPLTFGTFAPGTVAIPTNKAYLKVADEGGEARQLTCVFDDESGTTGIGTSLKDREEMTSRKRVYNLNGQRVNKTAKGLYIVDGKKLIVR